MSERLVRDGRACASRQSPADKLSDSRYGNGVMQKTWSALMLASLAMACGSPPAQAPVAPSAPVAAEAPKEVPPPTIPQVKVPIPPPKCDVFVTDAGSMGCTAPKAEQHRALLAALSMPTVEDRDRALRGLETCPDFAPGLIRALRADIAPLECADVVVGDQPPTQMFERAIQETLSGLAIAAKLDRLIEKPPELAEPYTRERFQTFFDEQMSPWVQGRLRAVFALARKGSKLQGYGRGIVAYASSVADARFVMFARSVPIPDELSQDPDVRDAYYASLDEALDPYKVRSRDAGLVALAEFSRVGVLHSERVTLVRRALSMLFAGKPVGALDALWVPIQTASIASTTELELASMLPTFYAGYILKDADPANANFLTALLSQGIPQSLRKKLDATELNPAISRLFGRALFMFGQTYWDRSSFSHCARLLTAPKNATTEDSRFIGALCEVLQQGPRSAADAMASWQALAPLSDTSALDNFKNKKKLPKGYLAFDTAFIKQLATQPDTAAKTWSEIAALYQQASSAVVDPERKVRAAALSESAKKTAQHIEEVAEQLKLEKERLEKERLEKENENAKETEKPAPKTERVEPQRSQREG